MTTQHPAPCEVKKSCRFPRGQKENWGKLVARAKGGVRGNRKKGTLGRCDLSSTGTQIKYYRTTLCKTLGETEEGNGGEGKLKRGKRSSWAERSGSGFWETEGIKAKKVPTNQPQAVEIGGGEKKV